MVNIAVLGYGVVGSGVYEVLNVNKESITKKTGDEINIKYILDLREFPGNPAEKLIVHDFDIIANDSEIDIVVEAMGGTDPAYTYAKRSLESGKNYCTSNKELVAKHGPELLELAKKMNKNFLFEASVGGGIPIIRPLNHSLTSDEILEINGILNGTTNFILTKMDREGLDFATVLKEAQALGYAEKDPTADVEGFDACRKIAILSSLAFGENVNYEDIYTEGITKITDIDFKYAAAMNRSVKLLGRCKREDDKFSAIVAPFMIGTDYPLYSVAGVLNGILVKGNTVGDVMFYGSGAGKLPTASAVVSDIVEAAKHLNTNIMTIWSSKKLELESKDAMSNCFFVRLEGAAADREAEVKAAFGDVEFVTVDGIGGEFAFVTDKVNEKEFADKIETFAGVRQTIRVEK